MRFQFQEKPLDLYVAVSYTLVFTAAFFLPEAGTPLALVLVFVVPGYVSVAALFPEGRDLDWAERFALSLGLSVVVIPLLGLLLNFTPWGITFRSLLLTIGLFTSGVAALAYFRRMKTPPEARLTATLNLGLPGWQEYSGVDKTLAILLIASVAVASGTVAYVLAAPRPTEQFTEFYLLGHTGNATGYPTHLNISEISTVLLGIANHEAATVIYTVRVDQVGVQLAYNSSSGVNETTEVNRTTWSWLNVTLDDGQDWTRSYPFHIDASGLWKVQFFLYKKGDLTSVYRELHLYVRVS